jgi:hypothetical protein
MQILWGRAHLRDPPRVGREPLDGHVSPRSPAVSATRGRPRSADDDDASESVPESPTLWGDSARCAVDRWIGGRLIPFAPRAPDPQFSALSIQACD